MPDKKTLEQVAKERLDCALVESTRFTLARRFFPQIDVAFNVGKPIDYAWLVATIATQGPLLQDLMRHHSPFDQEN